MLYKNHEIGGIPCRLGILYREHIVSLQCTFKQHNMGFLFLPNSLLDPPPLTEISGPRVRCLQISCKINNNNPCLVS